MAKSKSSKKTGKSACTEKSTLDKNPSIGELDTLLRGYFARRPDPALLKEHVESQLKAFYEREERRNEDPDDATPDNDGFITVKPKKRARFVDPEEAQETKHKAPKTYDDFYRFQVKRNRARQQDKSAVVSATTRDQQILHVLKASKIL